MHARITEAHAKPLAALMAALHPAVGDTPGWDIPGCRAALWNARDRADVFELAHAAIELARRTDLRSPAVLAEDGPHWGKAGTPSRDEHRFARCPEPGHSSYAAHNCGACRSEAAEVTTEQRQARQPTPEQREAARNGAAIVRAAMRQHGVPLRDTRPTTGPQTGAQHLGGESA